MTTCSIDVQSYLDSLGSFGENFVRAGYGDPLGPPTVDGGELWTTAAWSILIYYNGTAYEFKWFYEAQSMRINKVFGQRGQFSFGVLDDHEYQQVVPFRPIEEMPCEVWAGGQQYASGYLIDINPRFVGQRDDFSDAAVYQITCTDLYHELELELVREVYTSKKLGFIIKDVLTRYTTLDASDIDGTLGFTVESFPINKKTPAQVLQHIADLLGMTYWIESSTRKVKLTTRDNNGTKFSTQFTDANVYDYFDNSTFSLRKQVDKVKTAIELDYKSRYTAGTVNVAQDSNIVAAFGGSPETFWDGLPADLQFKLAGSDAVYTVESNLSDGATQELRLSSDFKEISANDQAYELRGNPASIYLSDEDAIERLKVVRGGGTGIRLYQFSVDDNYFTSTEAFQLARALLILSAPLPQGQGTTYNSVFQEFPLEAGRTMDFNLDRTKRYVGEVGVQTLDITDIGGIVIIGGQEHPRCQLDFGFTAVFTSDQAQMRKLMQDARKPQIGLGDSSEVRKRVRLKDTILLKDCVHVIRPIQIAETLSIEDNISTRAIDPADVLFYTDLDYTHSPWDYSFTSD